MIDRTGEDQKYSALYRRGYGIGPVGDLFAWCVENGLEFRGASVIDCGCGRATLRELIPDASRYVGVDVSSYIVEVLAGRRRRLAHLALRLRQLARLQRGRQLPSERCRFLHASLDSLPFERDEFDLAWCCDVMEHISPAHVDSVLDEVCRVGRRAVFSISTRPSRILDPSGGNLHLTVEDASWWASRLAAHGEVRHTSTDRRADTFMALVDVA